MIDNFHGSFYKEFMDTFQKDYAHLSSLSLQSRMLEGIRELVSWDQETYMPQNAASIRAEQLELLSGMIHKQRTSPQFSKALAKLINLETGRILSKKATLQQKGALKSWYREYKIDVTIPKKFVSEFAKLTSQAMQVWQQAKRDNSFQYFAPYLDRIVKMNQEKAELIGYKEHPYDALLNLYEPGITTADVTTLFNDLRKSLSSLLKKIAQAKQVPDSFLKGKFSEDKQMLFGKDLLNAIGFDLKKGRLDLSAHPFSSSFHPSDNRITTRIDPTHLMSNISSVLHEAGHGFYEMGLPQEFYGTPLCESLSLGIHESQSRWWETRIGKSKAFWTHFLPELKKTFKGPLDKASLNDFYRAINKVEPSLIRVEADEVSYTMHIILRFELEKALIEGSLKVRDIPEAWNQKMHELLGITPPTNSQGCLQDVHWALGAFGYFPTYALGNIYASHLFLGFEKAEPNWESQVSKGEFDFVLEWLKTHIHQHGRVYSSKELLKNATGKELSSEAYTHYLTTKYKDIYKI